MTEVEVEKMLPMKIDKKSELIIKNFMLSLIKRSDQDIYERLKNGYSEMSQINLALAEMGLEQDMFDLNMYEAGLGCDIW
jgi:CopG family transcriptional regulator/antitoxin EndoAI